MATLNNLVTDLINYGGPEVAEIGESNDQFIIWTNNALVNVQETVADLINKWTKDSFTFSAAGYEEAVPTDWDGMSTMILYTDSDYQNEYDSWGVEFGVHRFVVQQAASKTLYRRYRQMPTVYTAMTNTVAEIDNPRLKNVIMEEIIAMFLSAQNDLEGSNAESNSLRKSDRNG